jgi:hypothetical protein
MMQGNPKDEHKQCRCPVSQREGKKDLAYAEYEHSDSLSHQIPLTPRALCLPDEKAQQ